jgi:LemA protein
MFIDAGPPCAMNFDPIVIALVALVVVAVLLLWWAVTTYNRLVRRRNQVFASWAQIDVQLKRRHDLIPNLVETVKGYAGHERATLDAVVRARASAVSAAGGRPDIAGRAAAESALSASLGRLLAVAEAYPDLRASQAFAALQSELAATEDKIAYARQFYNTAAQALQDGVQSFPSSIVAGLTGVRAADYFQASGAEQAPVQVRF